MRFVGFMGIQAVVSHGNAHSRYKIEQAKEDDLHIMDAVVVDVDWRSNEGYQRGQY